MKEEVSVSLITQSSDLPDIESNDFFHSVELFKILEATPKQKPCMAIATDGQGRIVAHLLATITFHSLLHTPLGYSHCHIYGEGVYTAEVGNREEMFARFVSAIKERMQHRFCLFIEISDLSTKMFGYGKLRENGFVPIQWQKIHNSLHSRHPDERLSWKLREKIKVAEQRGIQAAIAEADSKDLRDAVRLMRHYFRLKPRRTVPDEKMFELLVASGNCKMFVTKYRECVIGACICIFFGGNAYMWHLAARRKSFIRLHPAAYTVWSALKYAHKHRYAHMYFLDAGLPFKRNPMREFILNFGGKPVSEYRWFRIQLPWIGRIIDWLYNE